MVAVPAIDALVSRASFLRESLQKSDSITESIVSTLGSFDNRLSTLESAMRPTQVRTHAIRKAHENIDKTLKSAEVILAQFDRILHAETKVQKGPHNDLKGYLEAVEQLRDIVLFFSNNSSFKSSDGALSQANSLLSKAIIKLEDEFRQLLIEYSKPVNARNLYSCLPSSLRPSLESTGQLADGDKDMPSSNKSKHQEKNLDETYTLPTLLPPKIVALLHNLAQQLVQGGRRQQCVQIYREAHTKAIEESLKGLQVEKLNRDDVQKMPWETLEQKIGNWIHVMRIAVKLLFAGERKVCDEIFYGMDSIRDLCFAEVTANSLTTLLSFGDAIAKSKRSPEKLFVLLDMYEIMCELQPEIEKIFEGKACSEMRESALSLTKRLAQTAQETFSDFEEAVEKDTTKTAVLDGTVHPLTSYVINYVKFLFDYQSTLKQLFQESETDGGTNSKFAEVTMRIMQALQSNLEMKSKQYRDPALTYLFLMNNIHYIVRSVRRSEAKDLLGDDWIQRHRRIVQQNANQYKRVAWAKVLQTLSGQGLTSSGSSGVGGDGSQGSATSGASRTAVKERCKSFNMQFEEIHQRQSQWTVPDPELKESLRLAVAEVLLPAYRSFIKRFGPLVDNGKAPQKYIKYNPEDIERLLGDLFESRNANKNNPR